MNDPLALLADANPVRSEDLAPLELPDIVHRRRPPRRLALAAAGVAAVGAAALVGVFVYPGTGSVHRTEPRLRQGPTGVAGPGMPTVNDPLPPGSREVSLADAKAALGVPVVLPDTSPMGSPDPGPVWLNGGRLDNVVAVTYPRANLWILYETGVNLYHDDVLFPYHDAARQSPPFRVIDIDGVPANAAAWKLQESNLGSVSFQVAGVRVTIIGQQDDSTMQALARSIIDGYPSPPAGQLGEVGGIQLFTYFPPARQIDLADASATLGAPVVLPDTSLASPSDAGQAWAERTCPAPAGRVTDLESLLHACWIWISFPSAGLSVGYLRPPEGRGNRTQGQWEEQARFYGDNANVIELGDVPALAIEPQAPYPGSVEFDLDGTRIVVGGDYDSTTLQAIAQSIIDRSK